MSFVLLICLSCLLVGNSLAAFGWTWISGPQLANPPLLAKTKYHQDPSNQPDITMETSFFFDPNTDLLFCYGGYFQGTYDRFWAYNKTSNYWIYYSSDPTIDLVPSFGSIGVPSMQVNPGARSDGAAFFDSTVSYFYLFGGLGTNECYHNSLWRFHLNETAWEWLGGDVNGLATYCPRSVYMDSCWPGSRFSMFNYWINETREFVIGYGRGYSLEPSSVIHSDLWSYQPDLNQWAYRGGGLNGNAVSTISSNEFNPSNRPGSRLGTGFYYDVPSKRFFIFGGLGFSTDPLNTGSLGDMWELRTSDYQWRFVAGSTDVGFLGKSGPVFQYTNYGQPQARYGSFIAYDSFRDRVLIFGGLVDHYHILSDFWDISLKTDQFRLIGGSLSANQKSVFGVQGKISRSNTPGGRVSPLTFWDPDQTKLYLIGGYGVDNYGLSGRMIDVWTLDIPKTEKELLSYSNTTNTTVSKSDISSANTWQNPSTLDMIPIHGDKGSNSNTEDLFSLNSPGILIGLLVGLFLLLVTLGYLLIITRTKQIKKQLIIINRRSITGSVKSTRPPSFQMPPQTITAEPTFTFNMGTSYLGYSFNNSVYGNVPEATSN